MAEVTGSNPVEALLFFRLLPPSCWNWKFTAMITRHFHQQLQYNIHFINKLRIMITRDSYSRFRRKDKWFSPFAKHCERMVFIGMLLSTHLLFKDSQQKQMDDHLVWFEATVVESKLSRFCSCLLISFHELISVNKMKGHCLGNHSLS